MPKLPTGTVTFLFTDIEGSTRLLHDLGEGYRDAQNAHSKIVRCAIAEEGGTVVRTEGDSFFAVFRTPNAALRAAVAAQRALSSHAWSNGRSLRVRMGLHTGEGVVGGDDYIGIDVNRAARIAAAAWGGQVLLSEATTIMVAHSLPAQVAIRSLGYHRLKDLGHAEHLHELVIAGVPTEFPPPRTLEVPSNLPDELTSFVGRKAEVAQVKALLGQTRLLTVTGPGGTGKTRLALRVAAETSGDFPDGTFFVELAPVSDPALVVPTIASTLGVREEGWERPVRESLQDHLRDRRVLLVLDNFEHILNAGPIVTQLLRAASSLKVIVTSRAPLRLSGEQDVALSPMTLPDTTGPAHLNDLSESEAVALFVERARAVAPNFALTRETGPQVAEIVGRLDGLPLAIELAAMRAAVLTPAAMLQRMEQRLPVLVRGLRDAPGRQQTLRAAVKWSYDLLAKDERRLFRRLSTMVGGTTLEAVRAVCDPNGDMETDSLELLTALVDSSLVQAAEGQGGGMRFRMLQTVREFAQDELEASGERLAIERRHAEWFLKLAEQAEPQLRGPGLAVWHGMLQLEHDNFRAALRWAIENDVAEVGLRLAGALWRFWHLAGHLTEGRRWASAVLALPSAARRTATRAKALGALGSLAYWQNDAEAVRDAYEDALAISLEVGDEAAIAEATFNLGFAYGLVPARARSRTLFLRSREMFERLGNRLGVADCLWALALLAQLDGDHVSARRQAEESVRMHRELGDVFGLMDALQEFGRAAFEMGDFDIARSSCLEMLDVLEPVGYRTAVAITLDNLAAHENSLGRPARAMRLGGASEALKESAGGQVPPEFANLPDPREAARSTLSDDLIESLWKEGRAMTLGEAVAYARAEPGADDL